MVHSFLCYVQEFDMPAIYIAADVGYCRRCRLYISSGLVLLPLMSAIGSTAADVSYYRRCRLLPLFLPLLAVVGV
jgi:hypothetical protein